MPTDQPDTLDAIDVRPGQIWEWRGQEPPRDRWRVEFVGPDTAALALLRPPPDRRPVQIKRVSLAQMATEYQLIEDAAAAKPRGRRPGPLKRGDCPICKREYALRIDGSPVTHRTIAANGYTRLGHCPGGEGAA
jgi:hypothetical protein